MSIKRAIIDYLKNIQFVNERDIVSHIVSLNLTHSKTPARSVNRTLNELYKSGDLEKIKKQKYTEQNKYRFLFDRLEPIQKTIWYKKVVKTVIYCDGKKGKENRKSIFALTFEDNSINRYEFLAEKIQETFGNCYDIQAGDYVKNSDFGYMIEIVENPDRQYIYDNYSVGEE